MKDTIAIVTLLVCLCAGCTTHDVADRTLTPGEYLIDTSPAYLAALTVNTNGRLYLAYQLRNTNGSFGAPFTADFECSSNFVQSSISVSHSGNTGELRSVSCQTEGNTIHTAGSLKTTPEMFTRFLVDEDGDGFPDVLHQYSTNGYWTVDSITYQLRREREGNSKANKTLDATSQ